VNNQIDLAALRTQIEDIIDSVRSTDESVEARYIRLRNAVFGLRAVYEGTESRVDLGYIVPVSPVRADREAVERIRKRISSGKYQTPRDRSDVAVFDAMLAALQATPEPERAE
jgi:hypothetical protein